MPHWHSFLFQYVYFMTICSQTLSIASHLGVLVIASGRHEHLVAVDLLEQVLLADGGEEVADDGVAGVHGDARLDVGVGRLAEHTVAAPACACRWNIGSSAYCS